MKGKNELLFCNENGPKLLSSDRVCRLFFAALQRPAFPKPDQFQNFWRHQRI